MKHTCSKLKWSDNIYSIIRCNLIRNLKVIQHIRFNLSCKLSVIRKHSIFKMQVKASEIHIDRAYDTYFVIRHPLLCMTKTRCIFIYTHAC